MDYLAINRAAWDVRTEQHLTSAFYDVEGFVAGENRLNSIELALLPHDLTGKTLCHLMCHFGMDTLSFARMGAEVTGLDLSPRAIEEARKLTARTGLEATFVNGDFYSAPELVDDTFDYVFMSYGTVGWLPDAQRWAEVVAKLLKPGGQFIIVDFHPALWMLDKEYRYANGEAIIDEEGTYTDVEEERPQRMVSWNHGLGELIGALLGQQLTLKHFSEYDYSPYAIFGERGVEMAPGEWGIEEIERKLPLVYGIVAELKNRRQV